MRRIEVDASIRCIIKRLQMTYSFQEEIGGILIGCYDAELKSIRITDMSFPYPGDRKSKFRFNRRDAGHQQLMDRIWDESDHTKAYIGEWHIHDQEIPIPSSTDIKTWTRISRQNNNFKQCCFLIVGREVAIIWLLEEGKLCEVERLPKVDDQELNDNEVS